MAKRTKSENKASSRLSNEESNLFTKECIETALMVLLKEKEFKDISITDIVNRAGVSRSAYYRNYMSKEDILNAYLNTVVEIITDSLNLQAYQNNDLSFWLTIFNRVETYSDKLLTLLKAGFDGVILENINKTVLEGIRREHKTVEERYNVFFWVGALYNVISEWVVSGMTESQEEMAEICQHIVNNFPSQSSGEHNKRPQSND